MVAQFWFLSVVVLGGPAAAPARSVAMSAGPGAATSHVVVPTGIAVPVQRHDARPAASDLFRVRRCRIDPAGLVVGDACLPAMAGAS